MRRVYLSFPARSVAAFTVSIWIPLMAWAAVAQAVSIPEAVEQPGWTFTTGGNAYWSAAAEAGRPGGSTGDVAHSGAIGAGESSWLQVTAEFPADGIVSFWGKLVADAAADVGYSVYLDGLPVSTIDGGWEKVNLWVTAGRHTILWMMYSDTAGTSTAYLDECSFRAGGFILTVNSTSPGSGASVRIDRADLDGQSHGTTPMTREYKPGYLRMVASPRFENGNAEHFFASWSPGCSVASGTLCEVDLQSDLTITAHYAATPLATLPVAIDQDALVFSTGPADAEWYGDTNPDVCIDKIDTARATAIGQTAFLETTKFVPANEKFVQFCWGCLLPDSASDSLTFKIDATERASIQNYTSGECRAFPVSPGAQHVFRWELAAGDTRLGDAVVDKLGFSEDAPVVTQRVLSVPSGQTITVTPGDIQSPTPFYRSYPAGTEVTLTAPAGSDPFVFVEWKGCDSTSGTPPLACKTLITGGANVARYQWGSDIGLAESVNQPSWVFTTGGAAGWVGRTDQSHDGVGAAVSGLIADGEESFFETTQEFQKNGLLQFSWKVSSQVLRDGLAFYLDDFSASRVKITGAVDWQQITVPLTAGEHTLRWAYSKDAKGGIEGSDAGWVDEIRYIAQGISWLQASDGTLRDSIELTWEDIEGETGYRIYRRAAGVSEFTLIEETLGNVAIYRDPQGCSGGTYEYVVTAVLQDGGETLSSPRDTGYTAACRPGVPPAPTGVTASDGTGKFKIQVSWADVGGESGYKIYRQGPEDSSYILVATVGAGAGGSLMFADKRDCGGETNSYRITAFNASGESDSSLPDTGYTSTCGLNVDVPAGGEAWEKLSPQTISWSGAVDTGQVKLQLYKGRTLLSTIKSSTPTKNGKYAWVVPGSLKDGADYKIKLSWNSNSAIKALSRKFEVKPTTGTLEVTQPTAGAEITQGSVVPISWKGIHPTGKVKIELVPKVGSKTTIAASAPNTASDPSPDKERNYSWKVPATLKPGDYAVRVTWTSNAKFWDDSAVFTVKKPDLAVEKPDGSDVERGSLQAISWKWGGSVPSPAGSVKIELVPTTGAKSTIAASTPNDGEFPWTVPMTTASSSGPFKVRVTWIANPAVFGESGAFAVIAPSGAIDVTQQDVEQGTAATVSWRGIHPTGKVKIELVPDAGALIVLAAGAPNTSSDPAPTKDTVRTFNWKVPAQLAPGKYTTRVTWLADPTFTGNATFNVAQPTLAVTKPDGSDVQQGSLQTIAWSGLPTGGSVRIELNPVNAPWSTIIASTPNTGTFSWKVPASLAAATGYKVQVTWLANTAVSGASSAFAVTAPASLTVTAPGSSDVRQGEEIPISWTGIQPGGNVKIELVPAMGAASTIAASAPNNAAGTYSWKVPGTLKAGHYQVRVTWLTSPGIKDESDTFKVVASPLQVTEPNLAETVLQGATRQITWDGIPRTGKVKIELVPKVGTKSTIAASVPNIAEGFSWKVPGTLKPGAYRVRVTWLSNTAIFDDSDEEFTVAMPTIQVTKPAGGTWNQGSTQELADSGDFGVRWDCSSSAGNVKIELYKGTASSVGTLYKVLLASTPNDGHENVAVPAVTNPPQTMRVKVTWLPNPTKVFDFSEPFTVE